MVNIPPSNPRIRNVLDSSLSPHQVISNNYWTKAMTFILQIETHPSNAMNTLWHSNELPGETCPMDLPVKHICFLTCSVNISNILILPVVLLGYYFWFFNLPCGFVSKHRAAGKWRQMAWVDWFVFPSSKSSLVQHFPVSNPVNISK